MEHGAGSCVSPWMMGPAMGVGAGSRVKLLRHS